MTDRGKLAREHLAFLWPSIQAREEVVEARRLCATMNRAELTHLLRYHSPDGITDQREIDCRRTFDYALQTYSLLTVALIAGYVPEDLGKNIAADLTGFLGLEPVRLYYENHYPLFLPSLLRMHTEGSIVLPHDASGSVDLAWGSFQWFVRFAGRFEKDRNLYAFLDLLDNFNFVEDGLDIRTFLDGLKDPATALTCVLKPADLLNRRDRAVLGLLRFMLFCREFDPALRAMAEAPLTQSACWFYYAYWFKEFGADVDKRMDDCLAVFEQWLRSSDAAGGDAAEEGKRAMADVRTAMSALVKGDYSAPLVNRLNALK